MQTINLNNTEEKLTPTPKPLKQNINMENSSMTRIEEKIDKILTYQKHMRRIAIFRGILSFLFFFVFVIAPIIGGVYLVKYFNEKIGVEKVRSQYQEYLQTFESITKNIEKIPKAPKK